MPVDLTNQLTDVEIAANTKLRPVKDVASDLGLTEDDLESYGKYKAKISYSSLSRILSDKKLSRGKLILVTAITPTKSGEGKTTVTIGLTQALRERGVKAAAALREPSMGPVFGQKGGGTGGGYSQIVPMDDINLHFTGDLHAISSANNLLAALIDNHLHFGNVLNIDPTTITFKRAIDINERSLRSIIEGVGGKSNGVLRETGFDITAASEIMALTCLSDSFDDLKKRLAAIVIGRDTAGKPVTAEMLGAQEAMAIILKDAIKPNLVQTIDGTPAFVHGGPFANIAHGTSSVLSSRLALKLADYVVTEAGFGADLGFEKFCDIVAAARPELVPDAVVLVVTVKALKLHGGIDEKSLKNVTRENQAAHLEAIEKGFANAERHASVIQSFGLPVVIAVNRFTTDLDSEVDKVLDLCQSRKLTACAVNVWGEGGMGGLPLADAILACPAVESFTPAYNQNDTIVEKLDKIARTVYGAYRVVLTDEALKKLKWLEKNGFDKLPVCVAKTQYSFSDDPAKICAPTGFTLTVRELRLSNGAGFVVALTGEIMTMPGLPKVPSSTNMQIDSQGKIKRFY